VAIFLDDPAVAIRVTERGERRVAAVLRVGAGFAPGSPGVVEHNADVGLLTGRPMRGLQLIDMHINYEYPY
jgi:hypothetical protein